MTAAGIPTLDDVLEDLEFEHQSLSQVIENLDDDSWLRDTPSPTWQVRHQISHLEFFDRRAVLALTDPESFAEDRRQIMAAAPRDLSVSLAESASPEELLAAWMEHSRRLQVVGRQVDPGTRVPWYGPSMSVKSFLTARLMECWAHGEDVVAAVDRDRPPTSRLRHVAHIGVATRAFALSINGLPADESRIDIILTAPDGATWEWTSGASEGRTQSISGTALDFCRVVTQRLRVEDSALEIRGVAARTWMDVAQAFAGPPRRDPR